MQDKNLSYLILILLIKAFVVVSLVSLSAIHLSPDEAQYWTWSQAVDFGYYSKPPGIAWEIFLGTIAFQNHEFGVRFFAGLIGFLLPIATYFLAKSAHLKPNTCFWSALIMAFSPLGMAASFLATTDSSMVLCWILSLIVMVKGIEEEKAPNFPFLGFIIACGALFKWPIYLFWIFPLFLKRFWSLSLIGGIMISLFGLIPSVIWNVQHDFATFKHVFFTVKGAENQTGRVTSNFFEFLSSQIALVSPILFILLLLSLIYFIRNRTQISKALQFCVFSSFSIIAILLIAACFKKIQGNWGIFAYPALFVFLSFVFFERKPREKWVKIGVVFSALLNVMVTLVPYAEMKGVNIPYRFNAFRHNMGWGKLPGVLKEAGFDPSQDFLFGDKYQTSSILSFYNKTKKRAYFFNLHGIRKNQFSYWDQMVDKEIGKDGYFVLVENSPHLEKNGSQVITEYEKLLAPYFERIEFLGVKPLFEVGGKMVKGAFIFKGIHYNGQIPKETTLY